MINPKQLIEQLKLLPPDTDVTAWIKSRNTSTLKTLEFEAAGRAVRILLPILGKPDYDYNQLQGGGRRNRLNCRSVCWRMGADITRGVLATAALEAAGIHEHRITDGGDGDIKGNMLIIHIPKQSYVTSFYHSDDLADWMNRDLMMQTRVADKKERALQRRQAREAQLQAAFNARIHQNSETLRLQRERIENETADRILAQRERQRDKELQASTVVVKLDNSRQVQTED